MGFQLFDDGCEYCIVYQYVVFGVVDDVDQLFVEQVYVECMDYVVEFDCVVSGGQMLVMVYCKGCYVVVGLQFYCCECLCQFMCIVCNICLICLFDVVVVLVCYDFVCVVFVFGVVDQVCDLQ